jgi:hypothetical protein
MAVHDANQSARALSVPACPQCHHLDAVRPIHVSGVASVVQYWSCACGLTWATRSGPELRPIAADTSPRQLA